MTNSILTEQSADQSVLTGTTRVYLRGDTFMAQIDEIDRQARQELEAWYTRRAREVAAEARALVAEQERLHRLAVR